MREGSHEGRLRLDLGPDEEPLSPKEKEKQRRMLAAKDQPEMDEINRTFEADWARLEEERKQKMREVLRARAERQFERYSNEKDAADAQEEA